MIGPDERAGRERRARNWDGPEGYGGNGSASGRRPEIWRGAWAHTTRRLGDDVNRFAGKHLLVPVLSRLMPRGTRVRRGAAAGLSAFALLVVAPILFGLRASTRVGRDDATASQVAPSVVSLPVFHAAPALRLAFDAHSRTQSPFDAVPPSHDPIDAPVASSRGTLATSAAAQPRDAAVARGYDATAPPALS